MTNPEIECREECDMSELKDHPNYRTRTENPYSKGFEPFEHLIWKQGYQAAQSDIMKILPRKIYNGDEQ